MPVSGLAITLNSDSRSAKAAIDALDAHESIDIGQQHGHKLPIVTDTDSSRDDKQLMSWINSLPGVSFVDITFIAFDEKAQPDTSEKDNGVAP